MTTDPRLKNLRDAQRRLRSTLIANADRLDKPFTDNPDKNPWDTFVRPAMRELKDAVDAIAAAPAAPVAAPPTGQTAEERARISAKLWEIAEHHIIAEWICCEPLAPKHTLCAKGYAALGMARTLLVDADPAEAWNPEAPVLDAVLALLPADSEPHRLALSTALGLGTSAPWDAIRERAAELAGQPAAGDRGAELERLRTENARMRHELEVMYGGAFDSLHSAQPSDRGAVFVGVRPQTLTAIASHLDARAVAILRPDSETYAGWKTVIEGLRRLAEDATPVAASAATPNGRSRGVAASGGDLIEEYLRFLRGQGPEPDLSDLPQQQREAFAGQFEIVKALFDRGPELPPIDRDPVARRLGLHVPAAETPGPETQGAHSCLTNLDRSAARQAATKTPDEAPGRWCKCRSCWGWFVEDHPGEDLDELGRDLGWWSGLPEHRDAPAVVAEPGKEN